MSSSGITEQAWLDTWRKYHPNKYSLTFWTFAVTLTLNAVIQFFHRTVRFMMLHYQTKFGWNWASSLGNRVEIVIFWLYKPLLWPWHWRQLTNFSAQHSGSFAPLLCFSFWGKYIGQYFVFHSKYLKWFLIGWNCWLTGRLGPFAALPK